MPRKHHNRSPGEGTVYRRSSDNLWIATLQWTDNAGKVHRPTRAAKTKKGAYEKLEELKAERDKGLPPELPNRATVGDFITRWLEDTARHRLAISTYVSYVANARNHIVPGLGRLELKSLTPSQVQHFLATRRGEPWNLSEATIRRIRAELISALNQAVRWGYISSNPASLTEPPRVSPHEMQTLSAEQARVFLTAIKGDRLEAFFRVALALGLRRSEALGLRWQDIDLEEGTLSVKGGLVRVPGEGIVRTDAKNRSAQRTLALPRVLVVALKARRALQELDEQLAGAQWQSSEYVFTTRWGTPQEGRNVYRTYQRILSQAGLPRIRLHDLRHSAASLLHAQGVTLLEISKLLGHSSIRVTGDIYTHLSDKSKRNLADKMDEMYGSNNAGGGTGDDEDAA